ncbi:MAG: hypothetical protein BMS9Abin21_139 [Thermodesulfovibrionia bacterium]|nr:MAG: hypothetical protein BMS9Abin21_139 [Thermodesulfovibrionia bacterium]
MLGTVLAQEVNLNPSQQFANLGDVTFGSIVAALIVLVLVIAAIVFFFMLVIGGIRWITSGGDKTQTESARNSITAALVGLVIVFAAWAIINLINTFFGINILQLNIAPAPTVPVGL